MRGRRLATHFLWKPPRLQEAWKALISAAPFAALQQALSTQLLTNFFQLGGTPAGQALPIQLMTSVSGNLHLGGVADGGNASAARRAAGEALAVAALRLNTGRDPFAPEPCETCERTYN